MMRFGYVMVTYFTVAGIGLSALFPPALKLVWNASASVPIGLYELKAATRLYDSELVIARPPAALAAFMAERHYLPTGVTLIKHVLALPGQIVCRQNGEILVDGRSVGNAFPYDHLGRKLPIWHGCRTLRHDEVFLMNRDRADSFDGRYFGLLPLASIVGEAVPIWTEHPQ